MLPTETGLFKRLQKEMWPSKKRAFVVKTDTHIHSYFVFEVFGGRLVVEEICRKTGGRPQHAHMEFYPGSMAETLIESFEAKERAKQEAKELRKEIRSHKTKQKTMRI